MSHYHIILVVLFSFLQTIIAFSVSIAFINKASEKEKCFKKIEKVFYLSGILDLLCFLLLNIQISDKVFEPGNESFIMIFSFPVIVLSMTMFDRKVLRRKFINKFGDDTLLRANHRHNGLIYVLGLIKWLIVFLFVLIIIQ